MSDDVTANGPADAAGADLPIPVGTVPNDPAPDETVAPDASADDTAPSDTAATDTTPDSPESAELDPAAEFERRAAALAARLAASAPVQSITENARALSESLSLDHLNWQFWTNGRPFRPTAEELAQSRAGMASADVAHAAHREATESAARAAEDLDDDDGDSTPTEVPPDLTAAAFFDVDNTMVQGASIVHFARGLASRNYFTYGDIAIALWAQAKFRITGKENTDDVAAGREKALSFIAGRPTEELRRLGEEIYDELISDKIWPGTRELAQMHLDAGQQVWLVTATPIELAQVIAERLGLTGALGTVAESEDGIFTGRLVGDILHGLGKAHAVRSLAIREGLNLKRCTAYSDSHNDLPMLSLVGTAVAINPDADLRDVARVRGWEIRDFRTARKAARIGVPTALALGVAGGGTAAAFRFIRK